MALRVQLVLAVAVVVPALGVAAGGATLGVNYGQVADNLPPPQAAAMLLRR